MYERKVEQGYKPINESPSDSNPRHVAIEFIDPIIEKIEHIETDPS
jgi:hypothetical protein